MLAQILKSVTRLKICTREKDVRTNDDKWARPPLGKRKRDPKIQGQFPDFELDHLTDPIELFYVVDFSEDIVRPSIVPKYKAHQALLAPVPIEPESKAFLGLPSKKRCAQSHHLPIARRSLLIDGKGPDDHIGSTFLPLHDKAFEATEEYVRSPPSPTEFLLTNRGCVQLWCQGWRI